MPRLAVSALITLILAVIAGLMPPPFSDSPEFFRLLRGDDAIDLPRLALEFAADAYPQLQPVRYLAQLDRLADRVRELCPEGAGVRHILVQINRVLFDESGFRGNTANYADPRNSYLNEVLDRRTGIPITLSIVYQAVARRLGLDLAGVNFPAHFLLRTRNPAAPLLIDAFHAGQLLSHDECQALYKRMTGRSDVLPAESFLPCPVPIIAARMLNNLRHSYLADQFYPPAIPVLERLHALIPSDLSIRRDLALCQIRAGRPGAAVEHLKICLDQTADPDTLNRLRTLLDQAWTEIAKRN